jgi:phage gp29-like protein
LVEAWKNVLRELRSQHVLVYGDGDEVDVLAGPTDGARVILDMVNYFDRAITRLLVGGTLTMGVSQDDAGSLAQSETHRKSGQDLVLRDKKKVDAAITRDLIGQFRRLNAAQLGDLGLGRVKPPRFSSEQDNEDAQVAATVASTLLGAGVPLRRDELYKKVGYTPPAEGDDVVEGRPAPAPGMGGPLGFPLG